MDETPWKGEDGPEDAPRPEDLRTVEVTVAGIWEGKSDPDQGADELGPLDETFVKLVDRQDRELPIFIGPFEAMSILQALGGTAPERPLAHDLLRIVIDRLGANVESVVIDDLFQGTFYARILLTAADGKTVEIDARPSDALAVGVRAKVPIRVAERVMEEAGRPADSDHD
jgi:bifunctional DNase/RNase